MKILLSILIICSLTGLYFYVRPKPIKRVEYLAYWIYIPAYRTIPMSGVSKEPFELYWKMPEIYTVTLNEGYKKGDTVNVHYKNFWDYTTYAIIQRVKKPIPLEVKSENKN